MTLQVEDDTVDVPRVSVLSSGRRDSDVTREMLSECGAVLLTELVPRRTARGDPTTTSAVMYRSVEGLSMGLVIRQFALEHETMKGV